jgi:hypothetical protein
MTVRAPESPVQVTCPTCFQRILLVPGEAPRAPSDSYLSEFSRLPEPIIISTQVPGPAKSQRVIRRAARRAARHANRGAIRQKRVRILQIAFVAAIGLAITGSAATFAYRKLTRISNDSWAKVVPGMDSPQKLLSEYSNACAAFRETCALIQDAPSRDRAIPKIQRIAAQLRGIPSRVSELGPLSPTQRNEVDSNALDRVADEWAQNEACLREVRSKRLLYSIDFFKTLQAFANENEAAVSAINKQWNGQGDDLAFTPSGD